MRLRPLLALLLLALAALPAAAQQVLYEPLPPPGSAYVRFVNAMAEPVAVKPQFLPAATLGTAPAERVGAYTVVERVAGRDLVLEATAGSRTGRATLRTEPRGFLTVVLRPDAAGGIAVTPVVDQSEFNQLRARLSFYNATPGCAGASLALVPDGPTVFGDVPAGGVKQRSVNPVQARLRATCPGTTAPDFALEGLEAGGMYSIWLMAPGASPIAFVTRDTTRPWRQ
jgi:hypothetical protein